MTSQEMFKHPPICKNQVFVNVARIDEDPSWQVQQKPIDFDSAGSPNSDFYKNKLFGYDEKEFLAKQYK